jgi:hypothetical protein
MPAQFEQDQITCVRAELKPATESNQPSRKIKEIKLPRILKSAKGYIVLSLKCNTPAVGSAISGEQLPTLVDSAGVIHQPCGILAGGKVGGNTIFEFDYCSLAGNLTLAEDGSVAKPFPDTLWLTEQAQSISEFYVLYMVKTNTILLSIHPAGTQTGASFEGTEGFIAK